jgi:hypothetical protein
VIKVLSLSLVAAFATVALSLPADAARTKSPPKQGISYYSAPVTAVRSNGTSRASSNGKVTRLSSTIPGIWNRAASPFGRQTNGHAFFDRLETGASSN